MCEEKVVLLLKGELALGGYVDVGAFRAKIVSGGLGFPIDLAMLHGSLTHPELMRRVHNAVGEALIIIRQLGDVGFTKRIWPWSKNDVQVGCFGTYSVLKNLLAVPLDSKDTLLIPAAYSGSFAAPPCCRFTDRAQTYWSPARPPILNVDAIEADLYTNPLGQGSPPYPDQFLIDMLRRGVPLGMPVECFALRAS